jgi:creatinine amidohydrolase
MGWMATDLNTEGVVGAASSANAQKGRQLIDHIAGQFIVYAREVAKVALPAS